MNNAMRTTPAGDFPSRSLPREGVSSPHGMRTELKRSLMRTAIRPDLPMSVGAIAMSASTIIVAANAQLLRGLRLRRGPIALERQPVPA